MKSQPESKKRAKDCGEEKRPEKTASLNGLPTSRKASEYPPVLHKMLRRHDGRLDLSELKDILVRDDRKDDASKELDNIFYNSVEENARSVVMIVRDYSVLEVCHTDFEPDPDHVYIRSAPLKHRMPEEGLRMSPRSPYINQPSAFMEGTGFFIGEGIIATAAHVFETTYLKRLSQYRFIRGVVFDNDNVRENYIRVHKSQVYRAQTDTIPRSQYGYANDGPDWAILKVAPAYKEQGSFPLFQFFRNYHIAKLGQRDPFAILPKDDTSPHERVYTIGHGLGLPMKVSLDGLILKTDYSKGYYETTLTSLKGNSGSPVFYMDTHELAGIYIRGTNRFQRIIHPIPCLEIVNDPMSFDYEGQECQILQPIRKALTFLK
ncbi:MAG: serine protease [Bacteroidota bacterium]